MNYITTIIAAIAIASALCTGCSQGSRDEAINRTAKAAKELNGRIDNTPDVVKEQIEKENERQNSEWTIENVTEHPIEACNAKIDEIDAKIQKAEIAYNRALSAQAAARTTKKASEGEFAKYGDFLEKARSAYKAAKESGKWPIIVNGFSLGEEAAEEKIIVALKKSKEAKTKCEKAESEIVSMAHRMKEIKRISDDLKEQRDKVIEYRENIRSGQLQSEIKGLVGVLNDGGVKLADIEAVNTTQGIDASEDVFGPSQSVEDKNALDEFLKGE